MTQKQWIPSETIYKEFNHLSSNYFNTAYFGPSPYRVRKKVTNALFKELDPSFYKYHNWMGIPDRVRDTLGRMLDIPAHLIAHDTSVTDIISKVASSFDLKKGDSVAVIRGDYPSNILPWMHRQKEKDFDLCFLENFTPSIEYLEKNVPKHCKVLNVSHVAFDTGRKIPLALVDEFASKRELLLIIDATQSLGGLNLDLAKFNSKVIIACSTYKWLLGPYGHAFAYYSPQALDLLNYQNGNWQTSINSKEVHNLVQYTLEVLPGARRLDRGQTPNMLVMSCLEASLDLFCELGLDNIEKHNLSLRNHFLENFPKNKFDIVTPTEPELLANIVSIKTKNQDPLSLERELQHKNFDVSVREGKIRISFHLFNTIEQINKLIEVLDSSL
jgi:selenocysteine lyase/cysteine desulfurase